MFLIFNWMGFAIVVVSLICYELFVHSSAPSPFYIINGLTIGILDSIIRLIIHRKYPKIRGGSLFFIPAYIFGAICILLGVIFLFYK
jgi:hypothetical protein